MNINLVTSITIASNTPDSLLLFSASNINLSGINHVVEMIPANYSTCKFGFFCKQEIVVEKATKIPFRFRLGSLQQCNFYEGKR